MTTFSLNSILKQAFLSIHIIISSMLFFFFSLSCQKNICGTRMVCMMIFFTMYLIGVMLLNRGLLGTTPRISANTYLLCFSHGYSMYESLSDIHQYDERKYPQQIRDF